MKIDNKTKVKTIKPKIEKTDTKWYKPNDWEFRENRKRKQGERDKHPSLVVGEKENTFANLGLTHSEKRGHHKNVRLARNPDPKGKQVSFVRDDLQYDDKQFLQKVLKNYRKLPKEDIEKIQAILNKKR